MAAPFRADREVMEYDVIIVVPDGRFVLRDPPETTEP